MPGRDYSVLLFDLSSAANRGRDVDCKYVFVSQLSAAALEQVQLAIDGGNPITIARGDRLTSCTGGTIRRIEVVSPIIGGTLELLLSNEALVPLASGGAGSGAADRILDVWWLPHNPCGSGDPFVVDGIGGGGLWPLLFSIEGNAPAMNVRGHRCGELRPAGAQSGVLSAISFPWQRLIAEGGAGGVTMTDRLARRVLAQRVSVNLRCASTGAKVPEGAGLQIAQGRGTLENLSGNNAGMGIVPDLVAGAASWWRFVVRPLDGAGLSVNVALPRPAGADRTQLARFGLELVNPDPRVGKNGTVNVYCNRVLVQSFTDMSLFPPACDLAGPPASTGFDVRVIDQGANVDAVYFDHFHQAIAADVGSDE